MATHGFKEGDRVEVFSNSRGNWVTDGVILHAPKADCLMDGFSIPSGALKVRSSAGTKWILPADVATNVRPAAGAAEATADQSLGFGGSLGGAMTAGKPDRPLCKFNCGRFVQPGLSKGMKPFDTCCKRCASSKGRGGPDDHDANCQGARLSVKVPDLKRIVTVEAEDPKRWLTDLAANHVMLRQHAERIFSESMGSSSKMDPKHLKQAVESRLLAPIEVTLSVSDDTLKKWLTDFDTAGKGSLDVAGFDKVCREVFNDRILAWFPTKLPVKAHSFVRQNPQAPDAVYEFGEKLGEGSFGIVHGVTHRLSGEKRVCKKIAKLKGKSGMKESEILSEIESMAMLDHPNVIKVYEYFNEHDSISQIMEPCYGGELQDRIDDVFKKGKPAYSEEFICDVMKQTLRALAFMHEERFMHKDLKPQNIMLCDKDSSSIKVIDFGLAELFEADKPVSDQFAGTLLYMAPEVFRLELTVKVDVWAAGVILYNLVTGDYPFMAPWPLPPGRDMEWWQAELQRVIQTQSYRPHARFQNGAVSPACRSLLDQMLQKDPRSRPDATGCLEHRWFKQFCQTAPTLSVGVTQCLEAYSGMPELKKAFFLLMAHQFSTPVINELREIFTHFDVSNRGSLSAASFREVLHNTGATNLQVEKMLHALDKDDSGSVDWTEFIAAALSISICGNKQLVEASFATLDRDCDGKITPQDIESTFAHGDVGEIWRRHLPDELLKLAAAPPYTLDQFEKYMGQRVRITGGNKLAPVE